MEYLKSPVYTKRTRSGSERGFNGGLRVNSRERWFFKKILEHGASSTSIDGYCQRFNSSNMSRHECLWCGSGAKMSCHEWVGVVRHKTIAKKAEFLG